MQPLEQLLLIFVAATILAAVGRRAGAPYAVLLGGGAAVLAMIPCVPDIAFPPDLVLPLFVAPILVAKGHATSLHSATPNWISSASLTLAEVILTATAAAVAASALLPALPWAAAMALGAIVAPVDVAAAATILRPLRSTQWIIGALQRETLFSGAGALVVYQIAVNAVAAGTFSPGAVTSTLLLDLLGGLAAGYALSRLAQWLLEHVHHTPTAVIVQILGAVVAWQLSARLGMSGAITTACFTMALARIPSARVAARLPIPTDAIWATVVFVANILAFTFMGLELHRIGIGMTAESWHRCFLVGASVGATIMLARIASRAFTRLMTDGPSQAQGALVPTRHTSLGTALVSSWSGMRGILTLATALALPLGFPGRDLIMLVAFLVVVGTLLIQGLTLKPMARAHAALDDRPVEENGSAARQRVIDVLAGRSTKARPGLHLVRENLRAHMGYAPSTSDDQSESFAIEYAGQYRAALHAAREELEAMRDAGDISVETFRALENDLDWLESSAPLRETSPDPAS